MPTNFGTTPYSTDTLNGQSIQFPISAGWVPNSNTSGNLTAVQLGPSSTDTNGYTSAPAAVYVADGSDTTLGTTTDASSANTLIGLTKAIKANTASVTIGTLPSLPAGSATIGSVKLTDGTITGTFGQQTMANSFPVVLASNQSAIPVSQSGTWNLNNISGTISLPTGASTDATVAKLNVAQGASLGSNTGPMVQGSVTTNAPSYTTGQISPLSLDASGLLRASLKDTPSNTNNLNVNLAASNATVTVAGSGTFTVGQATGTNLHTVVDSGTITATTNADTSIGGTTAPSKGLLVIGKTNDGTPQYQALPEGTGGRSVIVEGYSGGTAVPVSGTFWQATQPVSGTVSITANSSVNVNQIGGTAVVTGGASGLLAVGGPVASGASNADNPLKVGGVFNTTQPTVTNGQVVDAQATARGALLVATGVDAFAVNASQSGSWTVTANAGTNLNTSALALDTSVNGLLLAQGSTTSGQKGPLALGAVTTNAPSYTTAQSSPLSLDASGLLRASLKDTPSNTNNFNVNLAASAATVTVAGTVTANQGGSNWTQNLAQVGGTATVTAGVNGTLAVGGNQAAGNNISANTNPVLIGGSDYGGTAKIQTLKVDSSGNAQVAVTNTPTVTANAGTGTFTIQSNASVNVNQVAGNTVSTAAAGTQLVGIADGSGNALTSNSTTYTSKKALDANLLGTLGTAFTTAGFVDIKGADGNVFVRQATASNLNAQVVGSVASGSADSGNPVKVGGVYNSSPITLTSGQRGDLQLDASGYLEVNIKAGAGSGGFSATDEAAWTAGSSSVEPVGGVYNDSATALTSGQEGTFRSTANRALHVNLRDASANQLLGSKTSANSLPVVIASDQGAVPVSGTFWQTTQPVSGTVTANQGGAPWSDNLTQIAGNAIGTAASGVMKVGIVGNSGATVDSTVGAGTAPANAVVVGSLYNTTAPAPTNGQAMALQADQGGNLRIAPGISLAALSAWNSSTALNTTQAIFSNSGVPAVLVQLDQTTTLTAGAITFEATYDGSNWVALAADQVLDPTSATLAQISLPYTLQASTNKPFLLLTHGAQGLHIKLSTAITGSGAVTPNYALLPISPVQEVIALSPTAANFNVTVGASSNTIGKVGLVAGTASIGYVNIQDSNGSNIVLGQTTMASSLPVTIASNQGGIGSVVVQAVAGTALGADQTNSILKTSLYVKKSAAADTVLTLGSATSANSLPVVVASDQGAIPVSQSGSNWSVNVAQVAGGATSNAGQTGALQVGGAVATNTAVSSATYPLLIAGSDYGGTPKVQSLKVDSSGNAQVAVTNTPTVTANAGTNLNTSALALESGGNLATLAGGVSSSKYQTNIAQIGGATPQMDNTHELGVSLYGKHSAAGDTAVAVDASGNVGVNVIGALPAGSATIGAVTQASGPWTANITQFGGNALATGTGASGSGIPRMTVSNDSELQLWDGTNGPVAVKAANTSPVLTDKALTSVLSPNNTGLPVTLPKPFNISSNKSSGSVASLAQAFGSNNTAGNSIVVVCAVGNGTAPTISDTNSNTYTQVAQVANGTAFNTAVFLATGIASGANTATVNNGGSTASIAMTIYEVPGLLASIPNQPDSSATNTGSSGTASTSALTPASPNTYAFTAVGVGTAAQTITAATGWTNDSGQQNPTTPAGLFSFVSMSRLLGSLSAVTPQATFTSEPWAMAVATFRPVIVGIEGSVKLTDGSVNFTAGSKTSANSFPVVVASDQAAIPASQSGTWTVGSNSATGSAVPANAFYHGGLAKTALPTAASDGNLTGFMTDKFGRLVTLPQGMRDIVGQTSISTTTSGSQTLLAAGGSGIFTDIAEIILVNTSATGTLVTISDGTNSYYLYATPTDMRGASQQVNWPATSSNTAWTINPASAVTTLYATIVYLKNK